MKHKAVNFGDSLAKRIELDGILKGLALKMANNKWGAYDTNEVRLTAQQFDTPKAVARWFDG